MHPDRRRAGRAIRKQRREAAELMAIVEEYSAHVSLFPWSSVVKAMEDIIEQMSAAAARLAEAFTRQWLSSACPDCRDGKHAACIGMSWSVVLDVSVECPCAAASHPGLTQSDFALTH